MLLDSTIKTGGIMMDLELGTKKLAPAVSTTEFLAFMKELGVEIPHTTLVYWINKHSKELEEKGIVGKLLKKTKRKSSHYKINKRAFLEFLLDKGYLTIEDDDEEFYKQLKGRLKRTFSSMSRKRR